MSRRTTSAPRPSRLHARRPLHRARPAAEGLEARLALAALGLDPTFGAGGAVLGAFDAGAGTTLSNASAVAVQADGKVVVAGTISHRYFGLTGSTSILAIRRYNADGSVDTTFGTAGETDIPLAGVNPGTTIGIGTAPADVVIQPDGRIVFAAGIEYTAADLSTYDRTIVARVGTDGRLDGSFGSGGTTILGTLDARLNSVAVQPDGSIVAAGTLATGAINGAQIAAARLTPGGVLDPTFGSGGVATYGAGSGDGVITTAGGQILLAADLNPTTTARLNSLGVIYRLAANGAIDPTYGTNGVATVGLGALSALANAPDGKLAVAGIFNNGSYAYPSVARIDADGTVDPTFTAPVTLGSAPAGSSLSNFTALAVRPDGTILALVGGYGVESDTTLQVDRFLPSGGFDPTFGANGVLAVTVVPTPITGENVATEALQPNAAALTAGGRLVVAGTITVTTRPSSSVFMFAGTQGALARLSVTTASVPGDYDGDGKSDLAAELTTFDTFAYRPSGGTADVLANFGAGGLGQTIPAPGDYDGDGRTDVAAYLPAYGVLVYRPSAGGADVVVPFGLPGVGQSVPAPGDYDGDGRTDVAVYMPSLGILAYRPSGGGADVLTPFGVPGAGQSIPAPGDYDGDGKTDVAVYLPSLAELAYRPSAGGADVLVPFGIAGAGQTIPAPGDYDGDGKTDVAAYLPALGVYAYRPSSGGADVVQPIGIAGAGGSIAAPGDYDGDGKTDVAVYLPSLALFAYRPSSGGADVVEPFGASGIGQTVPAAANFAAFAGVTAAGTVAASGEVVPNPAPTDELVGPEVTLVRPKRKRHGASA